MPVSEEGFQSVVHSLEQGKFAAIFRGIAGGMLLIGITLLYLFVQFAGLSSEDAMDQAQIARAIASGEGFTTDYIRPLALWQLNRSGLDIPEDRFPDFSQPPLAPALNALPLLLVKDSWTMSPKDLIYAGDRVIAATSILLFFVSVVVGYFVARRLFDPQLALTASILVLVTDLLWQISLSGLPHMLLLLLFTTSCYLILLAMGAQELGKPGARAWLLQLGIGALFAAMTLTNWLACWFFFGYLFFAFFYYRPRVLPIAAVLTFAILLTPWIVRNITVSGHPFGLAIYPMGQEDLMRTMNPDFSNLFYGFRQKFRLGVVDQLANLFGYLGLNMAAGAFFLALFHPFKRPETARFRWCILAMWVAALMGMAAYGPVLGLVATDQLHSIFIPVMTFFGLAFLLVLWNRLGFQAGIARLFFTASIVIVCAIPMLLTLFAAQGRSLHWPPYVPPYIGILGEWYQPDEALCSDMPWAVAWYAQRRCLLLPDSPKTMVDISDYEIIGRPIRGLYLTPVSGDVPFLSGIASGPYSKWGAFILRMPQQMGGFPLKTYVTLPIEGQTVLYSDYDRWSNRTTQP